MKFKSLCSVMIISMLVLSGCSSIEPTKSETESNNQKPQEEINNDTNDSKETEEEIVEENYNTNNEESQDTVEGQPVEKYSLIELGETTYNNMDVLILYRCGDDEKLEPYKQIQIEKNISVQEKVQIVCNYITENVLNDVKFEVTVDENNIAQVNVIEYGNSFEGSTGAMISFDVIRENLLQDNSMDKWIDGFRLLDNSNPEGVMGHIELDGSVTMKQ